MSDRVCATSGTRLSKVLSRVLGLVQRAVAVDDSGSSKVSGLKYGHPYHVFELQ
jgi:hypothetical protein